MYSLLIVVYKGVLGECSGSVVVCYMRDLGFAGSRLTGSFSKTFILCLVLAQPSKYPDMTEKMFTWM